MKGRQPRQPLVIPALKRQIWRSLHELLARLARFSEIWYQKTHLIKQSGKWSMKENEVNQPWTTNILIHWHMHLWTHTHIYTCTHAHRHGHTQHIHGHAYMHTYICKSTNVECFISYIDHWFNVFIFVWIWVIGYGAKKKGPSEVKNGVSEVGGQQQACDMKRGY